MLNKKSFALGLSIITLLTLLITFPSFGRLDFSIFSYKSPDSLYMLPTNFVLYLIIFQICLLVFSQLNSNRLKLFMPFVLAWIFLMLYPLSQLPSIRYQDTFYHATYAEKLGIYGKIPKPSQSTWQFYFQYPGTFLLWNIMHEVTSMDFLNLGYLISAVSQFLFIAAMFLLGKKIIGKMAYLLPSLFLLVSPYMDEYTHFCPQVLCFPFYILCIYFMFSKKNDRRIQAIPYVLSLAILINNPTTMIFLILVIWGFYLLSLFFSDKRSVSSFKSYAIFLTVIWFLYLTSYAIENFTDIVKWFLDIFTHEVGAVELMSTPDIYTESLLQKVILVYRKVAPITILTFGTYVAIVHRKNKKTQMLTVMALGSAIPAVSGIMIARLEVYILIPLCLLALWLVRKWTTARARLVPIMLISLILVSFYAFHAREYIRFIHPWEQKAVGFVAKFSHRCPIGTDRWTLMVYNYYDPTYPFEWLEYGVQFYDPITFATLNFTAVLTDRPTFFEGQILIRSYRQDVLTSFYYQLQPSYNWTLVDYNLQHSTNHNLIYNSGLDQIYSSINSTLH